MAHGEPRLVRPGGLAPHPPAANTNVLAVAQLTAALVPSMVERGRGGVLNMGSGPGLTVMPAAAAYWASKHFSDGFSE